MFLINAYRKTEQYHIADKHPKNSRKRTSSFFLMSDRHTGLAQNEQECSGLVMAVSSKL